ncbi:hypothetical protein [Roseomonas sp. KE2513]|uniref:hypothetical protein n=1 Tax=Roseomonas sp. KE2513 TaxID=2479202 RepID=UPI0018E00E7E|nr:hypothetical protein [Roseomonas sp. KE2513]
MIDGVASPGEDDLERMVAASLAGALEGMLKRTEAGDRRALVQTLRSQMTKALAEAPLKGDITRAVALRARMAALFNAEFDRMEAAQD